MTTFGRVAVLAACSFVMACFAAGAEGFTLDVGSTAYLLNATAAPQGAAGTASNAVDFSPDPHVSVSYVTRLGDTAGLKAGFAAEDMIGTAPGFVQIVRAGPYASITLGEVTFSASLPVYVIGYDTVNDPVYSELRFVLDKYYKPIMLSTPFNATSTQFFSTTSEGVAWMAALDRDVSLALGAGADFRLYPAPWIYGARVEVGLTWGSVELALRQSVNFVDSGLTSSFGDARYHTRFYLEPRAAVDFGGLGLTGVKAFVSAALSVADLSSGGTLTWYGTSPSKGSTLTAGIVYVTGPLTVEAGGKYSSFDKSYAADGADPTFNLMVRVSYRFSL